MGVGRPKSIIKRDVQLNLKLTKFEFEKISRIAKEKNISKTDAILQGIDLLIKNKPKKIANLKEIYKKNHGGKEPDEDF